MGASHHDESSREPPPPRRRGPVPAVIGRLIEPLYRWELRRRNARFDRGGAGVVEKFNRPVISIGNLSVGGTGKTPMVMHIVRRLLEDGLTPCIAMRGYKSRSDGQHGGDEADAYRRAFDPPPPIVAQPDRAAGIRELERAGAEFDCIVLDDGFQHRQIARDLDIVLIDASRSPFDDRLLPAGWLREPVESLRRASCVVITHAELCGPKGALDDLCDRLGRAHGRPPIAISRHVWTALDIADSGEESTVPLDWLLGKRILAVCAIGNPEGFLRALRTTLGDDSASPDPGRCAAIVLRDHDPYAPATVARIARMAAEHHADAIVTTDKDWSKLRHASIGAWPCPVARPRLSIVFDQGREELESRVLACARGQT